MKYNSIIEGNLDLLVFNQETICLKKLKDGAYVINLDEYADAGTHWIDLFCKRSETNYLDSYVAEYISEEIYWE